MTDRWQVLQGDARSLPLPDASVDAIVCDPPYGLEFMGKEWDRLGDIGKTSHSGPRDYDGSTVFTRQRVAYSGSSNRKCRTCSKWEWDYPERKCVCAVPDWPNVKAHQGQLQQDWHAKWAAEALRVAKPGAHLVAFGGDRTHHRLWVAIEDAGWEIRTGVLWLFGQGFPKGTDRNKIPEGWEGWNTALKPAYEIAVLARKPLVGTVAQTVQQYGTGALNIDGTRIAGKLEGDPDRFAKTDGGWGVKEFHTPPQVRTEGRWPANVILDEAAAALLDAMVGDRPGAVSNGSRGDGMLDTSTFAIHDRPQKPGPADRGCPSRFFYTAKASCTEREAGLEQFAPKTPGQMTDRKDGAAGTKHPRAGAGRAHDGVGALRDGGRGSFRRNTHPTVKPVDLMRWLVRLVAPPGGVVLDPFCGSGSTGMAALDEGMRFIGVDLDQHYVDLAMARIRYRHHYEAAPVLAEPEMPQGRLF